MPQKFQNIPVHLLQLRLPHKQFKMLSKQAEKEGYTFAATLAKRLIINYLAQVNKK